MDYGKKLLEFRAKYSLTQKQLADIIGITLSMIHRYETGSSKPNAMHKIKFESKMKEWEEKRNV